MTSSRRTIFIIGFSFTAVDSFVLFDSGKPCFLFNPTTAQSTTTLFFSSSFPAANHDATITSSGEPPAPIGYDNSYNNAPSPQSKVNNNNNNHNDDIIIFNQVANSILNCLLRSDEKRKNSNDGASTGWTAWVDNKSILALQQLVQSMSLRSHNTQNNSNNTRIIQQQEDLLVINALKWIRWMRQSPTPLVIDLSDHLRTEIKQTLMNDSTTFQKLLDLEITDDSTTTTNHNHDSFLQRIGCRIIALPSGKSFLLTNPQLPAGALALGQILYGGVTRFRIVGKQGRRAGERTVIYNNDHDEDQNHTTVWLQYGGPPRCFQAVDMGPAALVEFYLLPKGTTLETANIDKQTSHENNDQQVMILDAQTSRHFDPTQLFHYKPPPPPKINVENENKKNDKMTSVQELKKLLTTNIKGLDHQVDEIIRRILDISIIATTKEAQLLREFNLQPVRGLLLYGPPGCGKTALAREIAQHLSSTKPKIVAAPQLLDAYVGESEKLVRLLFGDAMREWQQVQEKSSLHIIVIDEIDAVFRHRSESNDSGQATRASICNQLLVMLDGMKSLGNVLVIGMTNRRDVLDEALLRPGRLEVQIHIPLPNRQGRRELIRHHFAPLLRNGRLSEPLCRIIDGEKQRRRAFWKRNDEIIHDLSASRWTGGFSGADIAGLVRCAGSIALSRARKQGDGIESLLITVPDVLQALEEVQS